MTRPPSPPEPPPRSRRRPLGLRTRAAAAFGALALAVSALLSVIAYQLTRSYLLDQREATASQTAYINARVLRTALRAEQPDIPQILSGLQFDPATVIIVQVGGRWFSSSVGVGPRDLPASLVRVVEERDAGRQLIRTAGQPYVAVGVPVVAVDAAYYELSGLEELNATLSTLARALTAGALTATLAGSAIGLYASRRVLRPLGAVAATAAGIAGGNLDARLEAGDDRDLGPLVDAFNGMVSALSERIEREARFASDASHELRSPLAAIASAVSVARRGRHDPATLDQALDVLKDQVARFQRLVDDLLEISRAEAGVSHVELENADPAKLAADALATAGAADVVLDVTASRPGTVPLDRRRIGQVLVNLIDNAGRYAGGATRVSVERDRDHVRFAVEDEGPGIPPYERTYIFERFARGETASHQTSDGTGLGLALVSEHVRLHGGRVWVEEREGGGARFVVELPVRRGS